MPLTLSLSERAQAYRERFPDWPASWPHVVQEDGRDVLYGTWVLGNDYRNKAGYYGAYPPGFLPRLLALYPDLRHSMCEDPEIHVLHAFSGSLPRSETYVRCDLQPACGAELVCNAYELPTIAGCAYTGAFDLAVADPPYSAEDAAQYGTAGVGRGRATRALAAVLRSGGHLAWLDTCWPMHTKELWRTVGRISIWRSTNHRLRGLTILERQ